MKIYVRSSKKGDTISANSAYVALIKVRNIPIGYLYVSHNSRGSYWSNLVLDPRDAKRLTNKRATFSDYDINIFDDGDRLCGFKYVSEQMLAEYDAIEKDYGYRFNDTCYTSKYVATLEVIELKDASILDNPYLALSNISEIPMKKNRP